MSPLIKMERDPLRFPSPHTAEVPISEVANFAAADWYVSEDQPEQAIKLATLAESKHATGGSVAVLCSGPSLPVTWKANKTKYASTIGVNKAAHFTEVDWWAGLDAGVWSFWGWAHPRVGVCGSVRTFSGAANVLIPKQGLVAAVYDAPEGCPSFCMLMAIGFAFEQLKAASVDVYGCDMTDTTDFKGERDHANWSKQRWDEEREGVTVLRNRYGKRLRFIKAKA